jgi:hypothetical protein
LPKPRGRLFEEYPPKIVALSSRKPGTTDKTFAASENPGSNPPELRAGVNRDGLNALLMA